MSVVLEIQRAFGSVRCIGRHLSVERVAQQLYVVLHDDAIMDHGEITRLLQLAILEAGDVEEDVVYIPLAGLSHGVYQGRIGAVDRSGLAVRVGYVLVAVEDLDLIFVEKYYSAVAAILVSPTRRVRRGPLDMHLAVAYVFDRMDAAG